MKTSREQLDYLKSQIPKEGYALTITPTKQFVGLLELAEAQQKELEALESKFERHMKHPPGSDSEG